MYNNLETTVMLLSTFVGQVYLGKMEVNEAQRYKEKVDNLLSQKGFRFKTEIYLDSQGYYLRRSSIKE